MLTTRQQPLTNPTITLALAALALVATILAPAAAAQTRDVKPYYIAITAEQSFLRSGSLRSFYPIASLQPGTVLRVTGEAERWLRVEYPRGLLALVRADHATLNQAQGVVTLSRSGDLKALSDTRYGVDGSFRDLQGPATPATTRLKHHRTETSSRGVVFYVVDAPKGAAGYIEAKQARRAVPSEIQAHHDSLNQETGTQPRTQPEITQTEQPTAAESTTSVMQPMHIEPGPTPTERPTRTPIQIPTPTQIEPETQTPLQDPAPVELDIRTERAGHPGATLDPLPSLEALSAAFDAVRRQGTLEAEVDELVAAFERVLASTPAIEDNTSTRAWLQQRLTLLDIRKQLQQTLQDVAAARARLAQGNQQSTEAMAKLQASAIFDFVGKLTKSAVYDGNRLPLMFRLVSVGEGIPRTLGYIEPKEGLDLERKLGVLVGISGSATQRADLRLSTIGATSVVVLRSEESEKVRFVTEPEN